MLFYFQDARKELLTGTAGVSNSDKDHSSDFGIIEERTDKLEDDLQSDQVPTLAIHEKTSFQNGSIGLCTNKVAAACASLPGSTHLNDQDESVMNGEVESRDASGKSVDRKHGGKGSCNNVENKPFGFAPSRQDIGLQKVRRS